METAVIRKAIDSDYESIFSLLKEFALFQKTPEKVVNTAGQMKKDKDLFHCLVAEVNHEIVGYIAYSPIYYSWSGRSVYIDDLYITPPYRKMGIGKRMLESVIKEARETGCKKVRWQVSGWNDNAISFYKSMGAVIDDTDNNCDLFL